MEHKGGVFFGLALGMIGSCTAELVTLPIDVAKTRMQVVSGRQVSIASCVRSLLSEPAGWRGLWTGLSPALLRQSTYGALRYGLYGPIKRILEENPVVPLSEGVLLRVTAGSVAGCLSSVLANPCDLIKVRMQAGGAFQYRGLFHAFSDIVRSEGVLALWKGVGPTAGRATVLAAVELGSYDTIRRRLLDSGRLQEGLQLHLTSSLATGFLATLASSPFDVVKSRVMSQPVDPATGRGLLYRDMTHCFVRSIKEDGLPSLWRGFVPNYCRVGPRVVIVFVVMERLRMLMNQ